MSFLSSLQNIGSITSKYTGKVDTEGLEALLIKQLRQGGDFPVADSYVQEVRRISHLENIPPERVADALYLEPLSAVRLLSLCNSTLYSSAQKAKSIDSLLQRVGVLRVAETLDQMGTTSPLSKTLAGRAVANMCYQDMILKALLLDRLYPLFQKEKASNFAYRQILYVKSMLLFGLSYVKPNYYSACELDVSIDEKSNFEKVFRRLFQKSLFEVAGNFSKQLSLPDDFPKLVEASGISPWNRKTMVRNVPDEVLQALSATYMVEAVARPITGFADSHALTAVLKEFESKKKISREHFFDAIHGLCAEFFDRVSLLGLVPIKLPEYLHTYDEQVIREDGKMESETRTWPGATKMLKPFLIELKACLGTSSSSDDFGRLPQAINITLKSLVRALSFDRAVLFVYEKDADTFVPANIFGREVPDLSSYRCVRSEESDYHAIKKAFESGQCTYQGDPVFGDDWPFVAFPIVWDGEVRAVFYADKRQTKKALPLTTDEQVSSMALSEIWQNVPRGFY